MKREDAIKIKREFDKSIKHLNKIDSLTVLDCLQEIGRLRVTIYNLYKEKD